MAANFNCEICNCVWSEETILTIGGRPLLGVHILDAYATGVEAFKVLKNRYGLTEDSIDDTMIRIQEVFDDNESINQSMAQPLPGDIDDDELERELDDLIASKGATTTPTRLTEFDIHNLPDVPRHEVSQNPAGVLSSPSQAARRILQDAQ